MNMRLLILLLTGLLGGCNTDPSTTVQQPMTIRPNAQPPKIYHDGAIYQAADSRPLFEDRRARFVGDTIQVNLTETTAATKTTNEGSARTGSAAVAIGTPTVLGMTPTGLPIGLPGFNSSNNLNSSFNSKSALNTANKDSAANSNNISGTMTVTVIEVLPNGNLMVSGEKQIAINAETEFVRLSGVVNPVYITAANTINSTQLADAHVESKNKQSVDTAQVASMLSRFFVALLPF
ncbi:flagellar L-ring protein precursor [mine drainage metagenome]|uniref:Flagellar L-ring protein n=1 Tax=mine drainage metagenome TaxID=410659 RepID=A0A1J5QU82_9ZZZZ